MLKEIIESNAKIKPNSVFINELQKHFPQFFIPRHCGLDPQSPSLIQQDQPLHPSAPFKGGTQSRHNGLDPQSPSLGEHTGSPLQFDIEKFRNELAENNISEARDGYRLSFVGKDYARLQSEYASETLITPDIEHNSKPENANSQNIFITGDNLEALRHLKNAYRNRVKMIYIDPPYNTGKEFVYNDRFEFTDQKLKNALGYSDDDITRLKSIQGKGSHSAWLTFMYPRLKLAQKLLDFDGVIFISIDENEHANLKLLMDWIFNEGNYVCDLIRKTKSMTGDEGTGINIQHEYIICFARNAANLFLQGEEKSFESYKNPDHDPNGDWTSGDPSAKSGGNSTYFPIFNPFTKKEDFPPKGRFWAFSKETRDEYIRNGKIKFKEKHHKNERGFIFKRYKNELESNFNPVSSLDLIDNEYMNSIGTKEIFDIFGGSFFDNPKPTSLIKKLISTISDKTGIILDFFAGSGTTAHAVMELNAKDGGNRKFIMVQLDEPTNPDSAARNAGYQTIDEISRERIKRAAMKLSKPGLSQDLQDSQDLFTPNNQGNPENLTKIPVKDRGFKHYRLTVPTTETLDKITEFDPDRPPALDLSDNMIDKLGGLEGILQTWLIDDGYPFDRQPQEIDFEGYKAYYIDSSVLYIIAAGWKSRQTELLLNMVGKNELNLNTIIVFGYSFTMESLRELNLNVKNNLNRQVNIEIRY